jgi:hypothetical protein
LLIAAGAALGWTKLSGNTTGRYSGYWKAMDLVNEIAAEREGSMRAASAWHWAVFLRESADVDLIKLPHHLDSWEDYDEAERAADFATLADVDAFISHAGVLMARPELFELFAREFEVAGLFFDHELYRGLGPILVFVRPRAGEARDAVLFDEVSDSDVSDHRSRYGFDETDGALLVQAAHENAPDRLRLLGTELTPLPGDGHYWLTWHWLVEAPLTENYMLFEELGAPEAAQRWDFTRPLGHGIAPSSKWEPGTIVRDGWMVILAHRALDTSVPWTPLFDEPSSAARQLELWAQLGTLHPEQGFLNSMLPAQPGEVHPFEPADRNADGRTPDGRQFDERGYFQVTDFDLSDAAPR